MSTALKCPNPSCPYLFDPSTVPPGVVLACPRCGMRFTLGSPAAAAQQPAQQENAPTATFGGAPGGYPSSAPTYPNNPAYPSAPGYHNAPTQPSMGPTGYAAAPPPGYGAAPPRPGARPTNATFGEMTPETARPDGEEGFRSPVRANKFQTYILVGVGMISLAAAGVAIWYKMTHKNENYGANGGELLKYKDLNFSVEAPPKPWVHDEDMRAKLGAPYIRVYRRDNPEAYIAIGARDFNGSSARPSDLDNFLAKPINSLMMEGWRKNPLEGDKTWMGQETRGYIFSGVLKAGGSVQGEARAFGHKGVGYWFLAWTGEADIYEEQKGMFAEARRRCKLLEVRGKDWKEKVSPVVPFKGETVNYTILDAEGMWYEETERIKDEDPKADKLLRTKKSRSKDHQDDAELLVLLLDGGGGDPLGTGRKYVETQANLMPELRGMNSFKEHPSDALEGDPTPNTVDGNTPFVLLRSENSLDRTYSWFYAISAIEVEGKTVVVVAKCKWGERRAFDTKFVQIVKSLR